MQIQASDPTDPGPYGPSILFPSPSFHPPTSRQRESVGLGALHKHVQRVCLLQNFCEHLALLQAEKSTSSRQLHGSIHRRTLYLEC